VYTAGFRLASMDLLPIQDRQNMLHALVEALAWADTVWLKRNPGTPPLYQVAPSYHLKVRPMSIDYWDDIPTVMSLGGGDCKDFTAWRIAELRHNGAAMVVPEIKHVRQRGPNGDVIDLWHVYVRQGARTEDPSRILGMPTQVPWSQLRGVFQ
jgi:hypothetical protein